MSCGYINVAALAITVKHSARDRPYLAYTIRIRTFINRSFCDRPKACSCQRQVRNRSDSEPPAVGGRPYKYGVVHIDLGQETQPTHSNRAAAIEPHENFTSIAITAQHQDRSNCRKSAEGISSEPDVLAGWKGPVEEISCMEHEIRSHLLDKRHKCVGGDLEVGPTLDHA